MILGIDVGTTAVKAALLDDKARTIAEAEAQHNLHTARPGWAEEAPEDWWQGAAAAVRRVLDGRQPKAVGVSGMVPALVVLDGSGRPLRLSIQQNDARAVDEIRWFRERFPEDELFSRAGATWNAQVLPPKIRWLQQQERRVWDEARRLCGSYEYVTWRFTGEGYTEANWALESGMWDARRRGWIPELLDLLALEPQLLKPVRRPHEVVGTVTRDAHAATGILAGTPVIAGSADHIATALTAGLREHGDAVLEFGGAGNFLYAVAAFTPLRELFIDYHDLPDLFVLNGCMATSGSLVKWFRDRFTPRKSYAELDREAEAVPAGSGGVVLLPYFLGEKTPLNDPDARGTIVGLTLAHATPHLYRAILEGVAYAFRHHRDVLREGGHSVTRYYVMGGGARSPLWRRIAASVLGQEVSYLAAGHAGSAYGVAFVAGVAAGLWRWQDLEVRVGGVTGPDEEARGIYDQAYGVYRETYRRLKDVYPRLRTLERRPPGQDVPAPREQDMPPSPP